MARVFEVSFRLAAQMAGNFSGIMRNASRSIESVNQEMDSLGRNRSATQNLINLRRTVAESSRDYIQARQRVAELGRAMSQTENPTRAMRNEFEAARIAARRSRDELNAQRETLRQLNTQMGTTSTSTADLVRHQNELARASEKAQAAQSKIQKTMAAQQANAQKRGELRGQLFDAAGLAASLAAPVKIAADWEQKQAEFNKVANGSAEYVKKIADQAQQLSVETGVAREELIGAYIAAQQLSLPTDEMDLFVKQSAQMGVAFDTTGDKAGEVIKAWRSGMGLSIKDTGKLGDAVNHLSNKMGVAAMDIAGVLQRQGAVFKSAGLDYAQSAALATTMLSSGASEEMAATATKNFSLALAKGNSASKAQKTALKALGFGDPQALAKQMQVAPEKAIIDVLTKIKSLSKDQQLSVANTLFGSESIGGIMPLVANLDNLKNAFSLVSKETNYTNSLFNEFNGMQNTTNQQAAKAKEGLKALGTSIGVVLLPGINAFLAKAAPMALQIAQLSEKYPNLTKAIVGSVAAFMALKVAAIAGGYAFTFLKGGVLMLTGVVNVARTAWLLHTGAIAAGTATSRAALIASKALAAGQLIASGVMRTLTAAQWLLNAAMLANPMTWIVVGIVALIAAGVLLYKNWDTVKAKASALWASMKSIFRNGMNTIKSWLNSFSLFDSGRKLLQTLANGIKSAVSIPVNAIKGALSKVRKYLPFSDAKEGPLSELTASGMAIMHTLSQGMAKVNTNDMMQPFNKTTSGMMGQIGGGGTVDSAIGRLNSSGSSGGQSVQLTQNIYLSGGADAREQARKGASEGASDLMRQLERLQQREARLSY